MVQVPRVLHSGASQLPESAEPRGSEYAMLSRRVREAGLLDRRPHYYFWKIGLTALALAAGWTAFAVIGDSWWQLGTAVFLAVIFGQLGFLGHDAGHRQVFKTHRANYILGVLCGNLAIGLSCGWWTSKHNRHHAHPNTEDADPDIMIAVLAFSGGRARASRGIQRLMFRYQAYLLIPLLFLEGVSLHVSSIRAVTKRACKHRAWEATLLGVHAIAYLTAVFLILSPAKAVAFLVVQQGLFGFYLGCSFAPNHKGMPVLPANDKTDFLRRQVLTSRNVRGGSFTDFALGGLNYQIEHHLFPSMPRPSLRRSQALIAAFCAERDVPYCEATLLGSYAQALRYLNATGKLARRAPVLRLPRSRDASTGGRPSAAADVLAPHLWIAELEFRHRRDAGRVIEQHDLDAARLEKAEVTFEGARLAHHNARYLEEQDRAAAQMARGQRRVERGAGVGETAPGVAQAGDLAVRHRVALLYPLIVPGAEYVAARRENRADRHPAALKAAARLVKRQRHQRPVQIIAHEGLRCRVV